MLCIALVATLPSAAREPMMPSKTASNGKRLEPHTSSGRNRSPRNAAKDLATDGAPATRTDSFRRLAERRAAGQPVFLPRYQSGNDRRLYVRQTLREDHRTRIVRRPEAARAKFDKLSRSLFAFFRGTALLFYRDMAGEDAWSPNVLALGDVHPKNFDVMPSADNAPFFGVNDFDEAFFAPFTWDIKRGCTGFLVAADHYGLKWSKQRKVAERFVLGYIDGLAAYVDSEHEVNEQLRLDNSPKVIKRLLKASLTRRSKFLEKYLDETRERFRPSSQLVPRTSRQEEFQQIIDRYREDNEPDDRERAAEWSVKDVAERHGCGTASLGLERYYVLLEGPEADGSDDVILELKQARTSAIAGLAPPLLNQADSGAERIVTAHAVHLVGGDPFYGTALVNGIEYLVRELSPYKNTINLDSLGGEQWKHYAYWCGRVLAQAHARSDVEPNAERVGSRILMSIENRNTFVHDMLSFAEEAFDRLRSDHCHFKDDHALGAFQAFDTQWS